MKQETERALTVSCPLTSVARKIAGPREEYLRELERRYDAELVYRDGEFFLTGNDDEGTSRARTVLSQLIKAGEGGASITPEIVRYAADQVDRRGSVDLMSLWQETVCLTYRGKPIRVKTAGQKVYLRAMADNTITFGIGPAGTGKTYLAVCEAVRQLREKNVSRIILVRPAVEAGESLGFLPGDLREKVEPYLRPLYDAFFELLSPERFSRLADKGVIEIAPLAYMRGRTLNESFIILDEAQNTTPEQMKMFLTRTGFGSRVVVTGDLTQVDLPGGRQSGLKVVCDVLADVPDVAFVHLSQEDVVRHEIVQRVVAAYERYDAAQESHS
ncbi:MULTISPECIES: PhoH family protein [Jonquetella]|uniref:PhoH family protein n=1 Tax=Jonquetella TaxID=428711 RepID=UPI0003AD9044|nr:MULTISPECIES: PhoH family protein [Jonquetella]ERL24646.1 PhoH family protein [Jonquetella sp. BV3C21]